MDYKEFRAKVVACTGSNLREYDRRGDAKQTDTISISWTTGGQCGGSCWDTGEHVHRPVESEPEPEFEDLDKILEAICPNTSFLQYKRICGECIETDTDTHSEYYGNYTTVGIKFIRIPKLFEVLTEKGLI